MSARKRVFAAVGLIALLAASGYLLVRVVVDRVAEMEAEPLPTVTVEASYPGAAAEIVVSSVASPIEQQVAGVEGMVWMRSRSGSDGSYALVVAFKPRTDPGMAQALVQNRVQLAMPLLPLPVQNGGTTVKKESPGFCLVFYLWSPDQTFDAVARGNYAAINFKDELARVAGVGEIVVPRPAERRTRIHLDLRKLASHDLTLQEVVAAIRQQHMQPFGRPAPIVRFADLDSGRKTILKDAADASIIRLQDVARLDEYTLEPSPARFNGVPVTPIFIYPLPGASLPEVRENVAQCLARLRDRLPNGLSLDVGFDFTSNLRRRPNSDCIWIDVSMSPGDRQRTLEMLARVQKNVHAMDVPHDVLEMAGPPFAPVENQGCLLVRLAPVERTDSERAKFVAALRSRLAAENPDARIRLRDLSGTGRLPPGDYPVRLAVVGPDAKNVAKFASKLADRLGQSQNLSDVWRNPDLIPSAGHRIEINRDKLAELGVAFDAVNQALSLWLGRGGGTDGFHGIELHCAPALGPEGMKLVGVRGDGRRWLPLADFVALRQELTPTVVARFDTMPMEEITANPAPNGSLAIARTACTEIAEAVSQEMGLPPSYRIVWQWAP